LVAIATFRGTGKGFAYQFFVGECRNFGGTKM